MKSQKLVSTLVICLMSFCAFGQNNLLDTSSWTVGQGSVSGFNRIGTNEENIREDGQDPYGINSVLWKSAPDVNNNNDGGWNGTYLTIDHTKTYRLTVWVKKTNSNGGITRFGFNSRDAANVQTNLRTNGTALNNPYFFNSDLPSLDKWYLLVGYVHASDYTGTEILGGVYDPDTGAKVLDAISDYKFAPTALTMRHRAWLLRTTNVADFQFMYGPSVYEVNGSEPSIETIIDPNAGNPGGDSPWASNGQDISYSSGNVAIGRSSVPTGYKLAVDGFVRAREVRVDQDVWPDYVFANDYDLLSLEAVKAHIASKGHLPSIPSAVEVQQNGIELGEMNKLLLQKIEELTLYILQQEERIKKLENSKE